MKAPCGESCLRKSKTRRERNGYRPKRFNKSVSPGVCWRKLAPGKCQWVESGGGIADCSPSSSHGKVTLRTSLTRLPRTSVDYEELPSPRTREIGQRPPREAGVHSHRKVFGKKPLISPALRPLRHLSPQPSRPQHHPLNAPPLSYIGPYCPPTPSPICLGKGVLYPGNFRPAPYSLGPSASRAARAARTGMNVP